MDLKQLNRIRKNIYVFVFLSVLGLLLLLVPELMQGVPIIRKLNIWAVLLAFLLLATELLLGTLRVYVFSRLHKQGFGLAFRANMAGLFVSYATPFQAGGAAAQIFSLNQSGISIAKCVTISFMHLLGSLYALLPAALILFFYLSKTLAVPSISIAINTASIALVISIVVLHLILFFPKSASKIISQIAVKIRKLISWKWLSALLEMFEKSGHGLSDAITEYKKQAKMALLANLLISVLLVANKVLIGFVLLWGFGVDIELSIALTGVLALVFLQYVSPSPGGSFLSEGFVFLLIPIISKDISPLFFALLWRSFIAYIPAFISGLVVAKELVTSRHKT